MIDTRKFIGKVVLVTGASRGIGAEIARQFAHEGAIVIVNYLRNADAAQAVVNQCLEAGADAWAIQADVTCSSAVNAMMQEIIDEVGQLDVVVNNAVRHYRFDPRRRTMFDKLSWSDYQSQFEGSVGAVFNVCQAALPHFQRRAQGCVVNISTNLVENPVVPYHDYTTAKSALVAFSRNLAQEWGPLGVRVNCVAPGLVYPTDSSSDTQESFRDALIANTPLRRIARPEDIAGSVLFLASDWSSFMTGQVLLVDGGLVMR